MERPYDAEPGVRGFLTGTPNVPALVAIEQGAKLVAEAGIERIRAKAEALTTYLVELHDAWLAPLGFELGSPRDARRRGAHVSLRHAEAWPISRALIERARVIPDFRGPDSIRLGLPPLYTRFVDVHDAARPVAFAGRARRAARGRPDLAASDLGYPTPPPPHSPSLPVASVVLCPRRSPRRVRARPSSGLCARGRRPAWRRGCRRGRVVAALAPCRGRVGAAAAWSAARVARWVGGRWGRLRAAGPPGARRSRRRASGPAAAGVAALAAVGRALAVAAAPRARRRPLRAVAVRPPPRRAPRALPRQPAPRARRRGGLRRPARPPPRRSRPRAPPVGAGGRGRAGPPPAPTPHPPRPDPHPPWIQA